MTLDDFQNNLHYQYQLDTDVPSSSEDDYTVRKNLLYAAIDAWDNEKGILWNELWAQLSAAADGDKTVTDSNLTYNCPTDFRFIGTYVRTTDSSSNHTFWEVVTPHKAELFANEDVTGCYITGNLKTGYDLTFLKQPTVGHTINYPYYKTPFQPAAAANVIEMSDPWFAVYHALSTLFEGDGESDRAVLALQKAQARLSNMRTRNEMPAWLQENYVPDRDFEVGRGGFGV